MWRSPFRGAARGGAESPALHSAFIGYVIAFHAVWALWPYFGYPQIVAIGERTLTYAAVNIGIRLLVWVAPVFVYLRRVDGVEPLRYLKLAAGFRRAALIAVALTAVDVLGSLARFGWPHPDLARVTWNSVLGTSILVGFIEEIPYRGFMLRKLEERYGFWLANVITSLLFLWVHVPGWLALHTLRAGVAATVFVFGFLMGVAYRYSGSLWVPILTHSANDSLSFIVFQR